MPEWPIHTTLEKAPASADAALEKFHSTKFDNIIIKGTATVRDPIEQKRTFETGATRDTDNGKFDYEGFLSPLVIERFGEYMHKNRLMKDGSLRSSDNWQKGIPPSEYMKSLWRHFLTAWKLHRKEVYNFDEMEEALCGILFNTMGYLHSLLKCKNS